MRITVIGTSYLGCSHAVGMAEFGFETLGYDIDAAKVQMLSTGQAPIFEPGLEMGLSRHVTSGRLGFTTSPERAAEFGDTFFICVGTPELGSDGGVDMRQVRAAMSDVIPRLRRDSLVVVKSTIPVGGSDELLDLIEALRPRQIHVDYAFNPEFLREGSALQDTLHPDRIVLGTNKAGNAPNQRALALLLETYATPVNNDQCPVIVTDYATAELVKVAANSFLATKISFINAMADLCDASGADVTVLADSIGMDTRIGRQFLDAGLGYGGGCLPKDVRGFIARAGELGVALPLLRETEAINARRRIRAAEIAEELLGGDAARRRVAILGAAFKPESDDIRDSPALAVAGELHLRGADVVVYDPKAMTNAAHGWPTLAYAESADDACRGAELLILATPWQEFRALDPNRLFPVVARPVILDGRNSLDPNVWRAAGWIYRGIGRP